MNTHPPSDDSQSSTIRYYDDNAEAYCQATVDLDLSPIYASFLELLPAGAHILDVGCGSGRDSLYFLNHGLKVTAIDASPVLTKLASNLIGQVVHNIPFSQIDFIDEFDAIWACASLLHVSRSDISSVLNILSRSLKTGGVFYMSFKYGQKEAIRNGRLFNDYDEPTFLSLLSHHTDLKLLKIWTTSDLRPTRFDKWLNILLQKNIPYV